MVANGGNISMAKTAFLAVEQTVIATKGGPAVQAISAFQEDLQGLAGCEVLLYLA